MKQHLEDLLAETMSSDMETRPADIEDDLEQEKEGLQSDLAGLHDGSPGETTRTAKKAKKREDIEAIEANLQKMSAQVIVASTLKDYQR